MNAKPCVLALAGGVGGGKLAHGLAAVLPPGRLSVAVNTGDDFEHLGLYICPDVDTMTYTLAGIANPETGWGLAGETWSFMEQLGRLGGETWFRLGDRDLAVHVERTRRLRSGDRLSAITKDVAARLGVRSLVIPMSDQAVRTFVETHEGSFTFQDYFVRRQCAPKVREIRFAGVDQARPAQAIKDAVAADELAAIVICPSNPWLSVGPILAVPGVGQLLAEAPAPVVAVSPIVGGRAVKGPAAKIMAELGLEPSALAVAKHYGPGLLDGFVLDTADASQAGAVRALGIEPLVAKTVMATDGDRARLAVEVLTFAGRLRMRAGAR